MWILGGFLFLFSSYVELVSGISVGTGTYFPCLVSSSSTVSSDCITEVSPSLVREPPGLHVHLLIVKETFFLISPWKQNHRKMDAPVLVLRVGQSFAAALGAVACWLTHKAWGSECCLMMFSELFARVQ